MAETNRTGMTTQELLGLLIQGGAGLAGGLAQGKQNQVSQQQSQANLMDQKVQQMMAALQNAQQTGQNLQMNRQQMPQTQASLSPLGQEQTFLQRQRLMHTMLPEMAKFNVGGPTDAGVAAAYRPPTNMLAGLNNSALRESYGDQATATSLADRRKMMAQINPNYEFSSLGNFGLDPSFDQGVNDSQMMAGAQLKAYEAAQASLANQQTQLANQQMSQQTQAQPEKKGGGAKGFLGGVLKVAAPFAALIPGIGPAASIGLGAAAGALGNKMQGGGLVGGAVQGGLGAGLGEGLQSLSKGQGFNPFNNKALTSNMTPPMAGFAGTVTPQGSGNLASSATNSYLPFSQGASQQGPNFGNRMASVMGVAKPQQGTARTTGFPNATMPAYQGNPQQGGNPNYYPGSVDDGFRKATGIGAAPAKGLLDYAQDTWGAVKQQPVVQVAQTPVGGLMMGASVGPMISGVRNANAAMNAAATPAGVAGGNVGFGLKPQPSGWGGTRINGPAPLASRNAAGQVNNAVNTMNRTSQANIGNRGAQFAQQYQQGINAPNMATGTNAKNILNTLSQSNGMTPEEKAQFLMLAQKALAAGAR